MSTGAARDTALARWKRALFALLPALAMIPVAEVVLRAAAPDVEIRTPLARGGFLRPYVPGAAADLVSSDFRVRYAINAWGFRDLPARAIAPRAAPPPSVRSSLGSASLRAPSGRLPFRILLLGDSFTEGFGVEQADTYARRLEAGGRFEAWNLGRMGASPLFYVVMAREFVPRLRPEVVVVQLFDNDLAENRFRHLPRGADGRVGPLPESMRPLEGAAARVRDTWDGLALVQAFQRLERRLAGKPVVRLFVRPGSRADASAAISGADAPARLFPWYDPARTAEWDAKLAEQEVLVRQLVAELRESHTKVLLIYVPHQPELVPGDAAASRAANPHGRRLARVAEELGVPFLDGIELFAARGRSPRDYYFAHDQHWNAAGHALFAEALGARLAALLGEARAS